MSRSQAWARLIGSAVAVATAALAQAAQPASAPSSSPARSQRWQLTFTHGAPTPITVRGDDGIPRAYWYMTYKVENNTSEDRFFVPDATLFLDSGAILLSLDDLPQPVFTAIREHLGNPLLDHPLRVIGPLLQGPDYARESVMVWPLPEGNVDHVAIFVGGLSGETELITDPLSGDPVVLRKTLMIEYSLPGTAGTIQTKPVILTSEQWIMR